MLLFKLCYKDFKQTVFIINQSCVLLTYDVQLGVIQQLRGQEEGEGESAKSPRLSTQGGALGVLTRGQKFEKKRYRRIMANDYEKSDYST